MSPFNVNLYLLNESESEYKRQLLYLSYIHIDIWVHVYTIHDEWLKTFSMDENGDMEIFHMYVVVGGNSNG
jgi:hypothetical protein